MFTAKSMKRLKKWMPFIIGYVIIGVLVSFLSPASTNRNMWAQASSGDISHPRIEGFAFAESPEDDNLRGIIVRYALDGANLVGKHDQVLYYFIPVPSDIEYSTILYEGNSLDAKAICAKLTEDERSAITGFLFSEESKERAAQIMEGKGLVFVANHSKESSYRATISDYGWHDGGISVQAYFKWSKGKNRVTFRDEEGTYFFPEGSRVLLLPWTQPRTGSEKIQQFGHSALATPLLLLRDVAIWPWHCLGLALLYSGIISF